MTNHKHTYDETLTCFECGKQASPSEHCKQYGLTLAEVSRRSGVSVQTLINWHRIRPAAFRLIVTGAHHEAIA